MSGIVNKIKEAVSGDHHHSSTTGTTSTTTGTTGSAEGVHGPHSTRTANTLDPRVDSDRDGSSTVGGTTGTHTGTHGTHTGTTGGLTGTTGTSGTAQGGAGPHNSRIANTLDPRVDSDRDGSSTVGGTTGTHATHGTHSTTTGGLTGGSTGQVRQGDAGPHDSRIANTLDPRVDSDRDGSSRINPGVGSGPAPNTAGHHKSDIANKLDPRVDSDLDGSKTVGGNANYRA